MLFRELRTPGGAELQVLPAAIPPAVPLPSAVVPMYSIAGPFCRDRRARALERGTFAQDSRAKDVAAGPGRPYACPSREPAGVGSPVPVLHQPFVPMCLRLLASPLPTLISQRPAPSGQRQVAGGRLANCLPPGACGAIIIRSVLSGILRKALIIGLRPSRSRAGPVFRRSFVPGGGEPSRAAPSLAAAAPDLAGVSLRLRSRTWPGSASACRAFQNRRQPVGRLRLRRH